MGNCDQFGLGTRARQICVGQSELSLRKVNSFRASFGIEPLEVEETESVAGVGVTSRDTPRVAINRNGVKPAGGCVSCGGQIITKPTPVRQMVEGTGVGGRLIEMFKSHGFETCEACYELAHRMNEWGPAGCVENLELIVADILPRALAWEDEKVGWWAKLLPEAVTEAAIRLKVESAISTAKPLEWIEPPRPVVTRAVRHDPRKFVTRPSESVLATPTGPPIETVDLSEAVRHLTFHVWPVSGFGAWQWNCDRLIESASLFNGRRIVAIATDDTTDSADDVKRYLGDFTDEFVETKNDPRLREVATWLPMLTRLESNNGPHDVTFSCHAKGVRHKRTPDAEGSTVFPWTEAMWQTCSDWQAVRPLLETKATVGTFRRFAAHTSTRGFGAWHYSGTFYWWRNRDAFRRGWKNVLQTFFGTEAWPGLLFGKEDAGVIVCDDVRDLYKLDYWKNEIEPQLAQWRSQDASA